MTATTPPAPLPLTAFQRKHLRKLAADLAPLGSVGKKGITKALITKIKKAFAGAELVKLELAEQENEIVTAAELAAATGALDCGVARHLVVLYLPDPENPVIHLPGAPKQDQPWRKEQLRRGRH